MSARDSPPPVSLGQPLTLSRIGSLRSDGAIYVGGVKTGLFEGYGEYTCRTGDVFKGQFKEGKKVWSGITGQPAIAVRPTHTYNHRCHSTGPGKCFTATE